MRRYDGTYQQEGYYEEQGQGGYTDQGYGNDDSGYNGGGYGQDQYGSGEQKQYNDQGQGYQQDSSYNNNNSNNNNQQVRGKPQFGRPFPCCVSSLFSACLLLLIGVAFEKRCVCSYSRSARSPAWLHPLCLGNCLAWSLTQGLLRAGRRAPRSRAEPRPWRLSVWTPQPVTGVCEDKS